MDTNLIEAFWHADHYVFGRKLKPLTLRHCFVLATAGNPLITGARDVTLSDLVQAVEICSRESTFFLRGKKPSWWSRQTLALYAQLDRMAGAKFQAYLRDYITGPEIWQSENGGRKAKAHFTISLVAGLGHWMSVAPETAWNMTPGEANWLLAAAIEQSPHGSIDIASEEEMESIARILEREEGRAA